MCLKVTVQPRLLPIASRSDLSAPLAIVKRSFPSVTNLSFSKPFSKPFFVAVIQSPLLFLISKLTIASGSLSKVKCWLNVVGSTSVFGLYKPSAAKPSINVSLSAS